MGNYVFSTETLLTELYADAQNFESSHDFGKNILPGIIGRADIYAYDFMNNRIPGDPPEVLPYWRDVGSIDAFYEANLDLRSVTPSLNLYNTNWPLGPTREMHPPAKFVFDLDGRRGHAIDSIVSGGCIISGGVVKDSVLGRSVRVHSGAFVEKSVLFDNCDIGRNARVRHAILDKNVKIPEGASIGYDQELDRKHYHISDSGVVVVGGSSSSVEVTVLNLGTVLDRRTGNTP